MSHVLAGAPGDCCRRTVQHVGEKRGTIETVAGVETYVSRPKDGSNKKIVLFFADVYGPIYINSQLIMDYWADNGQSKFSQHDAETTTHISACSPGYLVVGLDYFEDDSLTKHPDRQAPGFDFQDWLKRKQARAPELVGPWVEAIRKDYGSPDSKYVCVGEGAHSLRSWGLAVNGASQDTALGRRTCANTLRRTGYWRVSLRLIKDIVLMGAYREPMHTHQRRLCPSGLPERRSHSKRQE